MPVENHVDSRLNITTFCTINVLMRMHRISIIKNGAELMMTPRRLSNGEIVHVILFLNHVNYIFCMNYLQIIVIIFLTKYNLS